MYKIGDKIVYPLYGAGVIEDIEDKEIDGEVHSYYVLNIPIGGLKIMISAEKADSQRVRAIHSPQEISDCFTAVRTNEIPTHENWNQRYKENMDKIKSGEISQVAGVFYALISRERERGLSTAEKKMMSSARQILVSEIVLSHSIEKEDAEALLDTAFKEDK
jgi:CarD family transcriptional regulator